MLVKQFCAKFCYLVGLHRHDTVELFFNVVDGREMSVSTKSTPDTFFSCQLDAGYLDVVELFDRAWEAYPNQIALMHVHEIMPIMLSSYPPKALLTLAIFTDEKPPQISEINPIIIEVDDYKVYTKAKILTPIEVMSALLTMQPAEYDELYPNGLPCRFVLEQKHHEVADA